MWCLHGAHPTAPARAVAGAAAAASCDKAHASAGCAAAAACCHQMMVVVVMMMTLVALTAAGLHLHQMHRPRSCQRGGTAPPDASSRICQLSVPAECLISGQLPPVCGRHDERHDDERHDDGAVSISSCPNWSRASSARQPRPAVKHDRCPGRRNTFLASPLVYSSHQILRVSIDQPPHSTPQPHHLLALSPTSLQHHSTVVWPPVCCLLFNCRATARITSPSHQ